MRLVLHCVVALLFLSAFAQAVERRSLARGRVKAYVCHYECTNGMSGASKVVTPVTVKEPATVSCGREPYMTKAVTKCRTLKGASADQLCQNCKVAAAPAPVAEPSKWSATQVGEFLALIDGIHTTCADPIKCMVILGRVHYRMHSTDAPIVEDEAEKKGCKDLDPAKFASCGPTLTKQCKPMQLVLTVLGDLHPAAGAVSKTAASSCTSAAGFGGKGTGSVWLYTARGGPGHHAILLQKSDTKFVFIQSWANQYPISVSPELDGSDLCKVFRGDATAVAKAFNLARVADFATQVAEVKFAEAVIERVNAGSSFSFPEIGACMTRATGSDSAAQATSVKDCLMAKIKARPSSEGPMARD